MTRYVWEPVERVLRGMFYDVLGENVHPPSLREVWIDMDRPARGDAMVIAEFDGCSVPGQSRRVYQKVIHEADSLRESWFGLRRRARGRVRYEAHSLYSQIIENHLLETELRAARESLSRLERVCADPAQLARAHEMYYRQAELIQRNHQMRHSPYQGILGADFGLANYTQTYTTNTTNLTATQQALMQQQLGRAMDQQMANAFQGGLYSQNAQSAYQQQALTYEQMRNAYSVLRQGTSQNDINDAFMYAMQELNGLGSSTGTEQANKKGMALLKENLTPEQLKTYEEKQYFEVKGGKSGKTYRIHHGRQMNIREVDAEGKEVQGLCFLPQGGLVAGDCMLAQKNALELDEDKALKVANKFPVQRGWTVDPRDAAAAQADMMRAQMDYESARMRMMYDTRVASNRTLHGTFVD